MSYNFGYTPEIIDLNHSLSRFKYCEISDVYDDIFNTIQQHFTFKSSGYFKYRDVIFEIWNFGDGWKGKVVNNVVNKSIIMQCMNGRNYTNYWDYSKHESKNPLLDMFLDLLITIDDFYSRTNTRSNSPVDDN